MTDRPDSASDRPARILIVDDEPLNVDYLEQDLEGHGFVTESAANGLEALERVAVAPPDLVLLDVMMPELDGISALRILKQDAETRLIPVVLMTALNAVEDRVRGIEAGADDFLAKPVDHRELLARIRTALSQKRAVDETMGELRSTSAHLERYGRQEREIAVLVVEWRLGDTRLPEVRFVARRRRDAVEDLLEAFGGVTFESEAGTLAAVFDGPDLRSRAVAAVDAGRAALAEGATAAAVASGPAQVGSTRVERAGRSRWVYGAEGEPVARASSLARRAAGGGLAVTGDVAAAVSHRFRLEASGAGVYDVLAPIIGDDGADAASARPADRRLRTVLVTDVVGSTTTVERLGDRAAGDLLAAHEQATRAELALFGGEEIDAAGDGFLASFDSPARAILCAFSVVGRAAALGLTLRVGIHTGELELVEGKVRGIALHVASRIAARAAPGEVLVSSTTHELTAGAGLVFVDRGEQTLKGVSEPKRLFAAIEGGARRPEAGAPPAPAGLTAREVDVLRLVAVGLPDARVAQQLFLSVRTVNAHLRSIYRKAGVRSRAAAGRFAEESGLI